MVASGEACSLTSATRSGWDTGGGSFVMAISQYVDAVETAEGKVRAACTNRVRCRPGRP